MQLYILKDSIHIPASSYLRLHGLTAFSMLYFQDHLFWDIKFSPEFFLNIVIYFRSSRPEMFWKKGILRDFAKFTGKHLCQGLFLDKDILTQMFFVEFCEIYKNIFLHRTPPVAARVISIYLLCYYWQCCYKEKDPRKRGPLVSCVSETNTLWDGVVTKEDFCFLPPFFSIIFLQ